MCSLGLVESARGEEIQPVLINTPLFRVVTAINEASS
jgi:hypothetical protein